jgi:metal-responsive CopG/Arc/MetJ family transcriptional regulator
MRVKTSITLPADLIARLDRVDKNRSAVLERAARSWLAQVEREARDRLDLEIIEKNATRMNRDAEENLSYQSLP